MSFLCRPLWQTSLLSSRQLSQCSQILRCQPSIWKAWSNISLSHQKRFAGHNKWSKIKHGKAVADQKRALQFTKISKEIIAAAKDQGPQPLTNIRLAAALTKAKSINMPKSNIESALAKATGSGKSDNTTEVVYGGVGPWGVRFIIECMTDNPNRAVKEVKSVLKGFGGSMTNTAYLFTKKGMIVFDQGTSNDSMDQMVDNSIEYGAEEIEEIQDPETGVKWLHITTAFTSLYKTYSSLASHNYNVRTVETTYLPDVEQTVSFAQGSDEEKDIERLVDRLEALEDVSGVWDNVK